MVNLTNSNKSARGIKLNGKVTSPSPPLSPRKLNSMHVASDGEETSDKRSRKKRKAIQFSISPNSKRFWTKDEELVILKGIIEYRKSTGVDYLSDSRAFFVYIKDDINANASKDQLMDKIRHLKKKFRNNLAKKPSFTNSHDSEAFDLSMTIWGNDKDECVDGNMDKAKGTKGKEAVTNYKPENNDGSAKGDSCDEKFPYEDVDKLIDKVAARNESEEVGADDELGTLQDALETTMFQHLGDHAKKMMIKNLKTLGAAERKELSGEWKALLVEEMLLKGKKHSFAAKLANEAIASSARTGN